jgi:hypothetical protein
MPMFYNEKATTRDSVEADTLEYRTQNLDLAAFLACRNHKPFRITPPSPEEEPQYAAFEFSYSPRLAADVTDWTSDRELPVLVEAQERCPGIGDAWMMPAPKDASKRCSKHLMMNWWKKADELADLEHIAGLGWHGFRRKFGTELKNAPPRDVRELGGWKSFATPLQYYQQSDEESMREALKTRRTLRSASGH